jgi:hypothetical protein
MITCVSAYDNERSLSNSSCPSHVKGDLLDVTAKDTNNCESKDTYQQCPTGLAPLAARQRTGHARSSQKPWVHYTVKAGEFLPQARQSRKHTRLV